MSYEKAFICTEGSSNTAMFQHNTTQRLLTVYHVQYNDMFNIVLKSNALNT